MAPSAVWVSAIVRLRVLEKYLPVPMPHWSNSGYHLAISSTDPGQATASKDFVYDGAADPSLPYSEVVSLDIPDPQGAWKFWRGMSAAAFENNGEIMKIRSQATAGYVTIAVAGVLILLLAYAFNRRILRPAQRITAALIDISQGKIDRKCRWRPARTCWAISAGR